MRVRWLGQSEFHLTEGSTVDGFLAAFAEDERLPLDAAVFDTDELPSRDAPVAVVPRL